MSFDNLCKLLAEKHPEHFASWLLGEPTPNVKVLKTELSIEPIRADSIILLQTPGRILHLEFQVRWESNPPLPLRLLDYWVRLHRLYRLPIIQVIVLLLEPPPSTVIETAFVCGTTRHEYQVLKMWEQTPDLFLNDLALLPFATLASAPSPERLLRQVAEQARKIESTQQRQEVSAYVELLAGLRFSKQLIRQLFQEDIMRESVIYQEILEEGRQEGRQEGELALILRQLSRRFGQLDETTRSRLSTLPLPLLEELGEVLLDFRQLSDLTNWLQRQLPD
jgi:predicted transposase/invertase (TIGR01784 family)